MGIRVVIAGGGTGGHLYPGIAVARELQTRHPGAEVSFAGTARGIEARVVPREGFPLDLIRSGGVKGKSLADRVRGALLVPLGLLDGWRIVSARRPAIVIGVGGYSSGPSVRHPGPSLWRFSGRARDQRGHGGGSAAVGSRQSASSSRPPDGRTGCG